MKKSSSTHRNEPGAARLKGLNRSQGGTILPHPLLQLQRSIGNQAIVQQCSPRIIQAKREISAPRDVAEQEADRIMRMSEPTVQRSYLPRAAGGPPCHKCQGGEKSKIQRTSAIGRERLPLSMWPLHVEGVTEEIGSAACDPEAGKVKIQIDYKKIPLCMADCAFAHEKAHQEFMQGECEKLSAAYKEAIDAIARAKKSGTKTDLDKAEEAAKKLEEATAAYEKWFLRTCKENEQRAYQAGIDKCSTKEIQDQCTGLKETEQYKKLMKQWETFKKNPPNCPEPPPEAKKEEKKPPDKGGKSEEKK